MFNPSFTTQQIGYFIYKDAQVYKSRDHCFLWSHNLTHYSCSLVHILTRPLATHGGYNVSLSLRVFFFIFFGPTYWSNFHL